MSTDLNYVRADTQALFKEPLQRFRALERRAAVDQIADDLKYEANAAQVDAGQDAQAQAFEQQGQEMMNQMADIGAALENVEIKGKFNAALYDKKQREAFGGYSGEGIPKGLAAAKKLYGDALHSQYIAEDFPEVMGDQGRASIAGKRQGARNALEEAYKTNLGRTSEEANEIIKRKFGEAEDRVQTRRSAKKVTSVVGKAASAMGHTLLKAVETLGIVDQPPLYTALEFSNVMALTPDEFKEQYPKQAADIARATTLAAQEDPSKAEKKELNWLKKSIKKELPKWTGEYLRSQTAIQEGIKAGAAEGWRIITGGEYNPKVINKFASNVTDNPKYQAALEMALPMASIVPMLAAEKFAITTAMKAPAYAFRAGSANQIIGKIADVVVPGRVSAWSNSSDMTHAATLSLARRAAASRVATDFVAERSAVQLGGAEDPVYAETARILGGIESGNLSDQATQHVAASVIRHLNEQGADITPADEILKQTLKSQVEEQSAVLKKQTGKSVPAQTAGKPPAPQVVEEYDRLLKELNVFPERNRKKFGIARTGKMDDGSIRTWFKDDATIDEVIDAGINPKSSGALERLGYDETLLRNLFQNDTEARLFMLFHEKGHVIAGDVDLARYYNAKWSSRTEGMKPSVLKALTAEREDRAMLYALFQFSEITGRHFRDVVVGRMSPASFADMVDGNLVYRGMPKRYEGTPAPPEVKTYFFGEGGARQWEKVTKRLAEEVSDPASGVTPARRIENLVGDEVVTQIHLDDFNEMGEIFRISREGLDDTQYGDAVYQAFVSRYGATKAEIAQGKNFFKDATDELRTFNSPAQIAKVEEIVNTWRSLKQLMKESQGTDMEENAVNLSLWYKSQIANGGTSYRLTHARTEAINRAALGDINDTSWASKPVAPPRVGLAITDDAAGQQTHVPTEDRPRGVAQTIDDKELARKGGHVNPDSGDSAPGIAGSTRVAAASDMPETGLKPAAGQEHGATGEAATAAREDDALYHADTSGEVEIDKLNAIERDRMPVEEGPSGPTQPDTHSLQGSPEDLYVLDLEEFAGIGATQAVMARNAKINVFHVDSKQLNDTIGSYSPEALKGLHDTVINEQLASMAKRIAGKGAYPEQTTLFHRALMSAKGIREIRADGKISASVEAWLDGINLRAGATGATNEEAIISGIEAATRKLNGSLTGQTDPKMVIDLRTAELYDGITHQMGREKFIDDYAKKMTSPEALKMQKEVSDEVAFIKRATKGACL